MLHTLADPQAAHDILLDCLEENEDHIMANYLLTYALYLGEEHEEAKNRAAVCTKLIEQDDDGDWDEIAAHLATLLHDMTSTMTSVQ